MKGTCTRQSRTITTGRRVFNNIIAFLPSPFEEEEDEREKRRSGSKLLVYILRNTQTADTKNYKHEITNT